MFDKIKDMLGGGGGDLSGLPLGGLEKYLEGVDYPIGIDDLMAIFKSNGAPEQLQGVLQSVGAKGKHTFNSQDDVVNSMKGEMGSMM
jgi:hypothetical protein